MQIAGTDSLAESLRSYHDPDEVVRVFKNLSLSQKIVYADTIAESRIADPAPLLDYLSNQAVSGEREASEHLIRRIIISYRKASSNIPDSIARLLTRTSDFSSYLLKAELFALFPELEGKDRYALLISSGYELSKSYRLRGGRSGSTGLAEASLALLRSLEKLRGQDGVVRPESLHMLTDLHRNTSDRKVVELAEKLMSPYPLSGLERRNVKNVFLNRELSLQDLNLYR